MKNPELFYRSVNILQRAYFKGTLKHKSCLSCAVGNLVAGNLGFSVINNLRILVDPSDPGYKNAVLNAAWTLPVLGANLIRTSDEDVAMAISATGYTVSELKRIEAAFENRDNKPKYDPDGYLGLCAVIDTLMEIHEFNEGEKSLIPAKEKIFSKSELVLIEL